jgi:hypothetical protein
VTATERIRPAAVDTVVTGEWIITLNAAREIYRDGAIAVSGGVIAEVGKRAAILEKYQPATLIDEPGSIVIPGMINGHRHLLCCAKGAMPEGGQTLSALRQFIYPSFAALTEDDMHVYARHAAAEMIRSVRRCSRSRAATTSTPCWRRWPPRVSGPGPVRGRGTRRARPEPTGCPTGCGWTPTPRWTV